MLLLFEIRFQLLFLRDQCLENKFDCVSFFIISPILIVLGNVIRGHYSVSMSENVTLNCSLHFSRIVWQHLQPGHFERISATF